MRRRNNLLSTISAVCTKYKQSRECLLVKRQGLAIVSLLYVSLASWIALNRDRISFTWPWCWAPCPKQPPVPWGSSNPPYSSKKPLKSSEFSLSTVSTYVFKSVSTVCTRLTRILPHFAIYKCVCFFRQIFYCSDFCQRQLHVYLEVIYQCSPLL